MFKLFFKKIIQVWFDKFNPILEAIGFSYTSPPFAAHVDLVQWATKIKWGDLTKDQIKALIKDGRSYLEYQLQSDCLHTILLNGRSLINSFNEWSDMELNYTPFEISKGKHTEIVTGIYNNRVRIIGWTVNIQSSFGVSTDDIKHLASKVQILYK